MKKQLAVAAAFAAIALPIATSSAVASTASPRVPCGVNWTTYSVYYNHCGRTNVAVRVDRKGEDRAYCLPPGNTYLGPIYVVENAYYIGGAGCSPVTKP